MKKRNPTNKAVFKISKEDAQRITLKEKSEMDSFWRKHCARISDPLTLIVKSHLFIENLLNEILTLCLPNSKVILAKSTFSYKIMLFESLDLAPNSQLVRKIREVNKLRNDFVHNLEKELTIKEIKQITKGLKVGPSDTAMQKLSYVLHYIIGYLHCLKTVEKLFPFASFCARNQKLLVRDKGYLFCLSEIKKIYPYNEISKILDDLKL